MIVFLLFLQIPVVAWGYRGDMARSAYRVHGPWAPVASLAGQIHQESAWRDSARSHVGAQGLAQFMPATAAEMAARYAVDCAPANPFSPRWAFACRDRYMAGQLRSVRSTRTSECSAWSFAFRAYNGGLGWIRRDRKKAESLGIDPDDWVAVRDVNAGRRESAHRENREYPERIHRLARRYLAAGWGGAVCLDAEVNASHTEAPCQNPPR